jgi:bacillolysin
MRAERASGGDVHFLKQLAQVTLFAVVGAGAAAAPAGPLVVAATSPRELAEWDSRVVSLVRDGQVQVRQSRHDTLIPGREHLRLAQVHRGVRVHGGELVRQSEEGRTVSLFGTLFEGIAIGSTPTLSADQAVQVVERLSGVDLGPGRVPELLVLPREDGSYVLTWHTRAFTPEADFSEYFIDAHTGDLVLKRSVLQHQASTAAAGLGTGVLNDQKKVSMSAVSGGFIASDELRPPALITFDMKGDLNKVLRFLNGTGTLTLADRGHSTDNANWTDGAVVDAHTYAGYTYDYFFKRFGRRGLDNQDIELLSVVHPVRREDVDSQPASIVGSLYMNAFYAGDGLMVYGEGLPSGRRSGGREWNYLAGGLDVVSHELTHGVTQYTSNLQYAGEPGALNESFSDMMGTSVEFFFQEPGQGALKADYLLGEDVITPGGLRSMQSPMTLGDPDHYSVRYTGPLDGGGVHINSGIPNHVYYLAIEGGRNRVSGLTVQGVGGANREQIEKVMYRAFAFMMPPLASFADARRITLQSARDLYGAGSAPERALTQAWDAVGVN